MWITIMTTITKLRQRCEMRGPQAPLSGMGTLRLTCFESNWNGIIIALTRVFYLHCLESGIRVVLIKFECGENFTEFDAGPRPRHGQCTFIVFSWHVYVGLL